MNDEYGKDSPIERVPELETEEYDYDEEKCEHKNGFSVRVEEAHEKVYERNETGHLVTVQNHVDETYWDSATIECNNCGEFVDFKTFSKQFMVKKKANIFGGIEND